MSDLQLHNVAYDPVADVLTFDGLRFSGELMRQFTATPCGQMFRIIERKDGVVTISQERDPLAAHAPSMRDTLRWISEQRYADRSTVTPETAWVDFKKLNERVCAIYDRAHYALPADAQS